MSRRFTVVRQIRPPHHQPSGNEFTFDTAPLIAPDDGQVLVENMYLSVDPYMRELMEWGGWSLGGGLEGRALGRVIESRVASLPVGTIVLHRHGWRTHALLDRSDVRTITPADGVPLSAYLGVLGGTGLTAYVGLTRVARIRPGEDVFVSAAAGAVGSAAGQIARLLGAGRVVGSAGSAAKVEYLVRRLGFDAAFDYRTDRVSTALVGAAPDGIDIYFDNVGGEHLAAAIDVLRDHGRIAWCGAVAQYNNLRNPPAAPYNLFDVVEKRLRIEGFLVRDHLDVRDEFERFLIPYIQRGTVSVDETVIDGFENIVDAFLGMLRGDNIGKMLIRTARE